MRLLWFGDWRSTAPVRGLRGLGQSIDRLDDRLDPGLAFERLLGRWRALVAASGSLARPGGLCDLGLDGDRAGRGRPAPPVRPVRRVARAGPAPAAPAAVRVGHEARTRAGSGASRSDSARRSTGLGRAGRLGELARPGDRRPGRGRVPARSPATASSSRSPRPAEYRLDPSPRVAPGPRLRRRRPRVAPSGRWPSRRSATVVGRRTLDDLLTRGRVEAERGARGRPCKRGSTPRGSA